MKTLYVRTKTKLTLLLLRVVRNVRKHALSYSVAMQLVITQRGAIYFNQTRWWNDSLELIRTFFVKVGRKQTTFT